MSDNDSLPPPQSASPQQAQHQTPPDLSWARPLKQFGLLAAGAGFMAASIAITRRSVMRKRMATIPKFYSSNRDGLRFDAQDRSLLAAEAFGLATLNVTSFGFLLVGGISWGFDLSTTAEMRERSKEAIRRKGGTVSAEEEAELEKMMLDLMERMGMDTPEKPETPETPEKTDTPGTPDALDSPILTQLLNESKEDDSKKD
ncbi:hypothetical protein G7046_g4664 [Stylonectria norvegica]|nr:hypothetical protein G7046_g4664 [Stylonectria norvegica]